MVKQQSVRTFKTAVNRPEPSRGHNRPPEDSIGANLAEANAALLRRAYIRAGGRELAGATIVERKSAMVL